MARRIYGYARISRPSQSIDRQIRNIKASYPDAVIVQEAYTGTRMDRPEWSKLYKRVVSGDTIVFDSVSRMSRNADEGVQTYFELYERGIRLEMKFGRIYDVGKKWKLFLLLFDTDMSDALKSAIALYFFSDEEQNVTNSRIVVLIETEKSFMNYIAMLQRLFGKLFRMSDMLADDIAGFNIYVKDQDKFYVLKDQTTFMVFSGYNYDPENKEVEEVEGKEARILQSV